VHGRGFRLRRYVTTAPTVEDLEAVGEASGRPCLPTLVVLRCASLEEDRRRKVLAQGPIEDIIIALSRNRWLRVIPRSTAFALTASAEDPIRIAAPSEPTTSWRAASANRVRAAAQTMDAQHALHLE
jgi:TolB-like protein